MNDLKNAFNEKWEKPEHVSRSFPSELQGLLLKQTKAREDCSTKCIQGLIALFEKSWSLNDFHSCFYLRIIFHRSVSVRISGLQVKFFVR